MGEVGGQIFKSLRTQVVMSLGKERHTCRGMDTCTYAGDPNQMCSIGFGTTARAESRMLMTEELHGLVV